MAPPVYDTISVRSLEFQGRHGATADERKTLRRFQLDIDVHGNFAAAVASDRLDEAVDYYALCALALELGTGRTFHLIEALAGAIVGAVVARWPGVGVTVEVRKLNPPCPGNPACSAVRLHRPPLS